MIEVYFQIGNVKYIPFNLVNHFEALESYKLVKNSVLEIPSTAPEHKYFDILVVLTRLYDKGDFKMEKIKAPFIETVKSNDKKYARRKDLSKHIGSTTYKTLKSLTEAKKIESLILLADYFKVKPVSRLMTLWGVINLMDGKELYDIMELFGVEQLELPEDYETKEKKLVKLISKKIRKRDAINKEIAKMNFLKLKKKTFKD